MSSTSTNLTTSFGTGEYRGDVFLGPTVAFGIASIIIVLLRLGFRFHKRSINTSDWCIGVALITSIFQEFFLSIQVTNWGYGRHASELSPNIRNSQVPLKLAYLNQIFFKITTMMSKLSLCFVYHTLFRQATLRLMRLSRTLNYTTASLVITNYVAAFWISIFQCTPIPKTWQPSSAGTCVDLVAFRYSTAAVNIITSLLVIATPLPALFSVQHPSREVTEFTVLILLGLSHTGCTIARLVIMAIPDPTTKTDPQWSSIPTNATAMIEMNIGIIAASLVVMRPCFIAIHDAIFGQSESRSKISANNPNLYSISCNRLGPGRDAKATSTGTIQIESRSVSTEETSRSNDRV